jgi:hypothetical protein
MLGYIHIVTDQAAKTDSVLAAGQMDGKSHIMTDATYRLSDMCRIRDMLRWRVITRLGRRIVTTQIKGNGTRHQNVDFGLNRIGLLMLNVGNISL